MNVGYVIKMAFKLLRHSRIDPLLKLVKQILLPRPNILQIFVMKLWILQYIYPSLVIWHEWQHGYEFIPNECWWNNATFANITKDIVIEDWVPETTALELPIESWEKQQYASSVVREQIWLQINCTILATSDVW